MADDNFDAFGDQRVLSLAFEIAPIPAPGALPMLVAGAGRSRVAAPSPPGGTADAPRRGPRAGASYRVGTGVSPR